MNYFIACHGSDVPGSIEVVEQYLIDQGNNVEKLKHPFNDYEKFLTSFSSNNKSMLVRRKSRGVFSLLEDFCRSVWIIKNSKIDKFIGAANIDTIPAIFVRNILRKKIPIIIYYPRDYSEDRFNNMFLDKLYEILETICVRYSDLTISNTKRAESKRMQLGLTQTKSRIINNGVSLKDPVFEKKNINRRNFVYIGDVTAEHGLYDFINCAYSLIDKLTIIGSGDEWGKTMALCSEKNIVYEAHYRKPRAFVLNYLKKFNGIGLAPYNLKSKWTYYCSPLKVGEYIASGIPVLMSDIPEVAQIVGAEELGIIYSDLALREIGSKINEFDTRNYNIKADHFYQTYNREKAFNAVL